MFKYDLNEIEMKTIVNRQIFSNQPDATWSKFKDLVIQKLELVIQNFIIESVEAV